MRLAVFQLDAAQARGGEQGLRRIEIHLRQARDGGAALAHLPELALPGYGAGRDVLRAEAGRAAETLARIGALVDETGVALAFGLPVWDGEAMVNAAVLLRPRGEPIVYAKRFLYGDYEQSAFRPGSAPSPIVTVAGLRVGLLVCFDVEFPETVRELALAGADLVLVPTALPAGESARFIARSLVPTRAFENGIFLSYADWCGADASFRYQGLSAVAAPDGMILAAANEADPATLFADLDASALTKVRDADDYLAEVRAAWRLTPT